MTPAQLPSALWPTPPASLDDVHKAELLLAKVAIDVFDPTGLPDWELCDELDPIALASLCLFAVIRYVGAPTLIVTPASHWRERGVVYGATLPIERLLPEGSDTLGGAGAWSVGGYEAGSELMALAQDLLRRGFVWDPDLQLHAETIHHCPAPELAALTEGRALEALIASARSAPYGKRL